MSSMGLLAAGTAGALVGRADSALFVFNGVGGVTDELGLDKQRDADRA